MKDKIEAARNMVQTILEECIAANCDRSDPIYEAADKADQLLLGVLQSTADDDEPITAEWCVANGAIAEQPDYMRFDFALSDMSIYWDAVDLAVEFWREGRGVNVYSITTRGQMRHLLAALPEVNE